MCNAHRILSGLALLGALGCSGPYCSDILDAADRPIAMCPGARDVAVCDLPGEEARYEESEAGPVLVGGELALCTDEATLGCPRGTEGEVRCVFDPSL